MVFQATAQAPSFEQKASLAMEHSGQKGNPHEAKLFLSWSVSVYGLAGWRCLSKAAEDISSGEGQVVCRSLVSTLGHSSGRWSKRRKEHP